MAIGSTLNPDDEDAPLCDLRASGMREGDELGGFSAARTLAEPGRVCMCEASEGRDHSEGTGGYIAEGVCERTVLRPPPL